MLLGHKTRIDKPIAGLVQHQMTNTQHIVATLVKQHSSSRASKTVPVLVRAVSTRLSTKVLAKVKNGWERFVNLMTTAKCERSNSNDYSIWQVFYSHETFTCNAVEWHCSCLFYISHHLPCRHWMYIASKEHKLQMLPALSIDKKWSTFAALAIVEIIETTADSLLPIVRMSKLKLPNVRLPEVNDTKSAANASKSTKEVAYIRLRRHERAKHVVLSSAEKYSYAKAMLQSLFQHLSDVSTADFYQELYAWKETVEVGLRRVKSRTANHAARTCDSNNDSDDEGDGNTIEEDAFSILDPAEDMATMYIMNALETATSDSSGEGQIKLNGDGVVTKTEVSNRNVDEGR
ncbi:unnamed protein product [Phytophthora fragariaefolia]|uniref:Unnamed protein product n=1 Tax=Phytophthora fragariaefolia TaxID=1490495 RepID=A0A9W6XQA2_9STRA|nr:unnamed protein product [Phytophthora fragariaefolia]